MSKAVYIIPEERISNDTINIFEDNLNAFVTTSKSEDIWLDFRSVKFITSMGLRIIFKLYRNLKLSGYKLHLFNVNSIVTEILESTGFVDFLVIENFYSNTYFAPQQIDLGNYKAIEEELNQKLEEDGDFLYINLSDTVRISFEGLTVLLKADKRASLKNKKLVLRDASKQVLDAMKAYNFSDLFTIE